MDFLDNKLELLSILSPEIKVASFLSLNMNHMAFLKYMNNLDINTFKPIIVDNEFTIEKDIIIYYVFLLAIMNENPHIHNFIFHIINKLGNKINKTNFKNYVESVNQLIQRKDNDIKKGGSNIKKMLYELGLIGAFIYIAFYDYFIITSGVWSNFYDTAYEIVQIGSQIQSGCGHYTPSKHVQFLAKYGFGYYGIGNSDVVLKIDTVIQCLITPTVLSNNLEEIYKKEKSEEMLMGLFNELSHTYPNMFSDKDNKKMGKELVLIQPQFKEYGLVINKSEIETIDIPNTVKQLQKLAEMPKYDFKQYIVTRKPPTQPTIETADETSAKSYLSSVTTFMADLYDVVKEIGIVEMTSASSLSAQNAIIYSIQDTIRNSMRNMEDMQISLKRTIEDKIVNATRLVSELNSLPTTLLTLFSLNTTALFIILYFTNKMKKMITHEAIENETLMIENKGHVLEYRSNDSLKKSSKRSLKNGGKKKNNTRR